MRLDRDEPLESSPTPPERNDQSRGDDDVCDGRDTKSSSDEPLQAYVESYISTSKLYVLTTTCWNLTKVFCTKLERHSARIVRATEMQSYVSAVAAKDSSM